MTDWGNYEVYHPGVFGLLGDLDRAAARGAYDRLMAAKPERIDQVGRLVSRNGGRLDDTDEGLGQLTRWFDGSVEADPSQPGRLLPQWYSVVNDLGLFLGDVLVARRPTLFWEFYTASRDLAYQRHVVRGFTKVKNPHFSVDFDAVLAVRGHRVVTAAEVQPQGFTGWVTKAEAQA